MDGRKRKTTEQFIIQAKKVHGDKYDYSKVEYKNQHTEVCVICPKHGEFWQRPKTHLRGRGCPQCGKEKLRTMNRQGQGLNQKHIKWNTQLFVEKCKEIFGEKKYDYSKTWYTKLTAHVTITCPKHGDFTILPASVLKKHMGCQKCHREEMNKLFRLKQEDFIERCQQCHGYGRYDYSQVEYYNTKTKVNYR